MRITVSVGAAVAVALFGLSSAIAAPAAAPQGDSAKGKANFERVGCWECHGHQGQGGNAGVRIADPVPLAWPAFLAWVRTTSGDMPPFTEKVLPNQDLVDIYAWLQSVPKGPDYRNIPLLAQQVSVPGR
jgi:mono/diheme cytochrome c family protein